MRNRFQKMICILLSFLLVLTACGRQQDSEEKSESVSELSTGEAPGTMDSAERTEASDANPAASDSKTPEKPGQTDGEVSDAGIVVANLYGTSSFFSGRVKNFSEENPVYGIQYVDAYEGAEPDRILMEVVNGKGPDVLYLDRREQLDALYAQGALGEIGRLISEENMETLLPGAIQLGTCEDRLYGIPLSVYLRTLLTSREYWQEDSWTIEDILSVLEERPEIKGLFLDFGGAEEFFYNMYFMLGMNIRNSPFLKDGSSGFDCQEFKDLLTVVKDMTHKAANNSNSIDRLLPLTEGTYLGIEGFIHGLDSFCDIYDEMGDNANFVGFPCDMGIQHYLMENGILAINQNAMEKEGIRELVNDLLSLESQKYVGYSISVRTDIPESQLIYNEMSKSYIWVSPSREGFQLPAKADGSSYEKELEEYVKLLKSAVPREVGSDEIFSMVMEEANGYFESDKKLEDVIDIIQSRVQMYLDERK